MGVDNANLVRIQCEAINLLFRCFSIDSCEKIFDYGERTPLEIFTVTGVIDHADYEYAIFIHRTLTLQNSSRVIWNF